MRRKEREITEISTIREILESCDCVRLALQDEQGLNIVPMSFGFQLEESGCLTLFMHSAREGRKIAALRANPDVAFEMDSAHRVYSGSDPEIPCRWGTHYQSLIGTGKVRFLTDYSQRCSALNLLMRHYANREFTFTPESLSHVEVLALEVQEFSGKRNF